MQTLFEDTRDTKRKYVGTRSERREKSREVSLDLAVALPLKAIANYERGGGK